MDFKDWIVTNSFTVPNCVLSIIVDCIKDQGIEEQDYQPHSHFLPIENDKKEFLEVSDVPKEVRKAMFNLRYFRIYPHENQEGFWRDLTALEAFWELEDGQTNSPPDAPKKLKRGRCEDDVDTTPKKWCQQPPNSPTV